MPRQSEKPKVEVVETNWLLIIAWLLVLSSLIFLCFYYFSERTNSCTSNPLNYAIEDIKEKYDVDYVYGNLILMKGQVTDRVEFGDFNITTKN